MIVNTPPFIIGSGVGSVAPPRIIMRLLVEHPEAVGVAVGEEVGEPLPFFRQESGAVGIPDRVVDVDGLVADVIVT